MSARRDQETSVESAGNVVALVGRADLTPMYRPDGRQFLSPPEDVDTWLKEGYRLSHVDLDERARAIKPLVEAALRATDGLVADLKDNGAIDASEEAAYTTALLAWAEVTNALGELFRDVHAAHPPKQGEAVTLLDPDGNEHRFDPSQVDAVLEKGFVGKDGERVKGWSRKGGRR